MVVCRPSMSTKLAILASQWLKTVQFCLLPGLCIACRKPTGHKTDLCEPCRPTLAWVERPCLTCALPLPPGDYSFEICGACLGRRVRMSRTVAAFAYTEPVSPLIAAYKYRGALQVGRVLGDLLLERLAQAYRGQALPQLLLP